MNNDMRTTGHPVPEVIAEFPLSTTQQRCWFLDQMQPGNQSLNIAVRWQVSGQLRADTLEQAFQAVIDRHEILRTRFVEKEGAPVQQVMEHVRFKLDLVDIRAIPAEAQAKRVNDIAHETAARPFDLGQPGLIRATLIRLAADRAMITFVVHQTCFDGYSIRVLGHEIGTIAQAIEESREHNLPDLPLQYGDFTLWQQEYHASGVLEEESAYWQATLADMSYFEIEPDLPRPAVRTTAVAEVTRALPEDFGPQLTATAQRLGVSTYTFGAALFSACMHRLTGADDLAFGTQIAGRMDAELEPLIGVFINNLVLRFPVRGETAIADHVKGAKQVVEGALSHQSMPFNRLVEQMNPPRDPSRTPLMSLNFNLQTVFMESRNYGGFDLKSSPSHAAGAIYDLNVAVMGRPTGWQMVVDYASDLFEESTVVAILDMLAEAFDLAFRDPTAPLSQIAIPETLAERGQDDRRLIAAAEQALGAHPMVAEAVVTRAGDALYGFVVPGDTGLLPLDQVPGRILDSLAGKSAMADLTGISLLGGFPRTSTGAVNKTLLPAPRPKDATAKSVTADPAVLEALKADWEEVLNVTDLTPDAHFFDLGGHSVLVLRVLTRIRDRWSVRLEVANVYEHATLIELARLVTERRGAAGATENDQAADEDWRVMRLRRAGEGQPFIAINNAATALALSTAGHAPRASACIRIFDADKGMAMSQSSFTEIAADYADAVRAAQPKGPYLLYGNCVHGNLAVEVARHLHDGGAEIAGVVMKDVWEPAYADALSDNASTRRREKWHALHNRLRAVRHGELSVSAMLGSYRLIRATRVLDLAARLGMIERVRLSDLEESQERIIAFLTDMRNRHRPDPVDFPVLHIVTEITPQGPGFSPSIGWENVVAPGKLKTVHLKKVLILRDRRIGVPDMAHEIEAFLGETPERQTDQ